MQDKKNGNFRFWAVTKFTDEFHPPLRAEFIARQLLDGFFADYAYGQLEQCPTTGKFHLQGLLYYRTSVRGSHFKSMASWCKGLPTPEAGPWKKYCSKEETGVSVPVSVGTQPKSLGEPIDYETVLKLAQEGRISEIPARIQILHFNSLTKIRALGIKAVVREKKALWLWGPARCGKSYFFRKTYLPDGQKLYPKPQSKWWDGYNGEKFVLLDDLDQSGSCLGHYLKIWLDVYEATGEIKGGTIGLAYDQFWITSNYHPSELWPGEANAKMLEAIEERCIIRYTDTRLDRWPDQDVVTRNTSLYKSVFLSDL